LRLLWCLWSSIGLVFFAFFHPTRSLILNFSFAIVPGCYPKVILTQGFVRFKDIKMNRPQTCSPSLRNCITANIHLFLHLVVHSIYGHIICTNGSGRRSTLLSLLCFIQNFKRIIQLVHRWSLYRISIPASLHNCINFLWRFSYSKFLSSKNLVNHLLIVPSSVRNLFLALENQYFVTLHLLNSSHSNTPNDQVSEAIVNFPYSITSAGLQRTGIPLAVVDAL
jgi:hypothetical protein